MRAARSREAFHKQQLAVKFIAAYCAGTYLIIVILCLTYWCHPVSEYWRVPVRNCKQLPRTNPSPRPPTSSALTRDIGSTMRHLLPPHDLRHILQHLVRPDAPSDPASDYCADPPSAEEASNNPALHRKEDD